LIILVLPMNKVDMKGDVICGRCNCFCVTDD
jgi:hypothetical protein